MVHSSPVNIAVFGLGYVGSVTAACLASLGHRVTGVDRDTYKIDQLNQARAPFYEPGLDAIIKRVVSDGLLRATLNASEALADADVALLCVGTPSERNGNLDVTQVRHVVNEIAAELPGRTRPLIVALRSTVFPGTLEEVVIPVLSKFSSVQVVSNPEFLREGSAVKDFVEPSLLVVGGHDEAAVKKVADLYSPLGVQACLVSLRTAEMIKYACNAFHAVKISFANEIGALSQVVGVPAQEVMDTLCQDVKLNASAAYLKPGFAFGGSCLPKDLRALHYRAKDLDLQLPLLMNTLESNQQHLNRAIQKVLDLPGSKLGLVGLAFKEDTDDLRESPVVSLIEQLVGKGREVRVWDPHIRLDNIYGSNRNFLMQSIPHISRLLVNDLKELLSQSDQLVMTQVPSAEVLQQLEASRLPMLNLSRL